MMKTFYFLIFLITHSVIAQVGIGTTDPKGALDITSENLGLVLPRVTSLEDVTNNNSGLAENGTIVYDISRNKTCFRVEDTWICIASNASIAVTPALAPVPLQGNENTSASGTSNNSNTND